MLLHNIIIFLLGASIGSFLNVLIDRISRNESITGRSYCESCKKTLAWFDLIPLLSFAFLKGKCRYCKVSLSLQYPIVELTTGLLFVFTYIHFESRIMNYELWTIEYLRILFYLYIISSLIAIFFIDLKHGIIPDKIVYPAIVLLFLFLILDSYFLIPTHLLSALGAFLFFLVIFLVTRGKGMGFGDVKLAFLMGVFLGFPKIVIALYVAFLTGALVSLILVAWGKKKFKGTIAFGPFLVFGTLIGFFFGEKIVKMILDSRLLNFW